jgi:hypothetical protein
MTSNQWDAETSDTREGDGRTSYEDSHMSETGLWVHLDDVDYDDDCYDDDDDNLYLI